VQRHDRDKEVLLGGARGRFGGRSPSAAPRASQIVRSTKPPPAVAIQAIRAAHSTSASFVQSASGGVRRKTTVF
jgi:hypothetical protein